MKDETIQELIKLLQEDTTGPAADGIATTDENLSVDLMFQQSQLPSLGRQIFSVVPIHGPTGALFNIRKKAASDEFELIRAEVEVYPSAAIKTGLTSEAVQDLRSMHGKDADNIIGTLLRGLANDAENVNTLAFLAAQAKAGAGLALTDSGNAQTNLFEVVQNVQKLVLDINSKNLRSYEACVVLPYKVGSSLMGLREYAQGTHEHGRGLFIAQIGQTKYFTHPDPTKLDAYVVLKDTSNHSKSSAIFAPYRSNVIEATDPDTGHATYHIFNRYAITASPLHVVDNEMIYSFAITL